MVVSVRKLLLLEEFEHGLPDCIVMYLNEQTVFTLNKATVLAEEFDLTRKVFMSKTGSGRANAPWFSEAIFTASGTTG